MKKSIYVFPILSIILFTVSCCKKECKEAGLGGDVTIVASLFHHSEPILNKVSYPDTVYLEFNTQNSPGADLSAYDTYFVGETGEDHVHLEGLKCGDYYIYAVGLDTSGNPDERVLGGIPYSFTNKSGEIHLDIPVTEH